MELGKLEKKFPEFQTALENLKQSEEDCAESATRYAQLEAIFRKQIKSQFLESNELTKTESNTCKNDSKSSPSLISSKFNSKSSSKNSLTSKSSERIQKKIGTSSTELLSRKSSGDVNSKLSPEQMKRGQLLKRIRQCHDSIEEVAKLSGTIIGEKKNFLIRLDKSNRHGWKSQKSKQLSVGKLEKHMKKN